MTEVAEPPVLAARGGAWLRAGGPELPPGVEDDVVPARTARPGMLVADLDGLVRRPAEGGQQVTWDADLPGFRRVHTSDPFGNRPELLQHARAGRTPGRSPPA